MGGGKKGVPNLGGVKICGGGSKSANGGSIYASRFGRGGGSKSAKTPASSRSQKISMILQFAPLIDQISVPVLGGFVVPIVDVECLKKCGVGQ